MTKLYNYLLRLDRPLWNRVQKARGNYAARVFISAAVMHFLWMTEEERKVVVSDYMSMKGKS